MHGHLNEEQVERYSMGDAVEEELAAWEEHLLVCESCRRRVAESDEFVMAMQSAAAEFRKPERRLFARIWFRPAPVLACLALAALAALIWIGARSSGPPALAIALTATRGPGIDAKAPPRTPLALKPDLAGLPEWPSCRLELVDRLGKRIWRGSYPGAVTGPLTPGIYFVRVYSPAGELYREYGLEIETPR